MQSRIQSAVEVVSGTIIAFVISVAAGQFVIFPLFHIAPSLGDNIGITGCFTILSIVRGYVVRRMFNWISR
jgi:hypothetical protein